jgi:threonine aldolase
VERLAEDHKHADEIAKVLENKSFVKRIEPVETNVVIFELNESYPSDKFIKDLDQKDIKVVGMGPQIIRMVTHLDVDKNKMEALLKNLKSM